MQTTGVVTPGYQTTAHRYQRDIKMKDLKSQPGASGPFQMRKELGKDLTKGTMASTFEAKAEPSQDVTIKTIRS